MSMNGKDLAREIKNALKDLDPAKKSSQIASKYQSTIENYLIKNMEITLSYSGMIPGTPPVPDLEPSFKGKLSFLSFKFLPAASKELFDLQLGLAVKGGFVTNGEAANGITFAPMSLNQAGIITTIFPKFNPSKDDVDKFMEDYCSSIIDCIKTSFVNPLPTLGARANAGSTGNVSMVSIQ